MKTHFILFFFIGSVFFVKAQNVNTITGTITGKVDIENIHVINKTSNHFTVTNSNGEFFIEVKRNDTISFTAVQYQTKEIVVDEIMLLNKSLNVTLEEHIVKLSEVIVGKVLTGNLLLDIGNSNAKPDINFYDVGIPGYMGRKKTQAERRLSEAGGEFKPIMLLGLLGGSLPLDPIINGISGKTKKLKKRIAFESKNELIQDIRKRLSVDFFSNHALEESKHMEFWYFCLDDSNFETRCKGKRDIEITAFLNEKYDQYLANSNTTTD